MGVNHTDQPNHTRPQVQTGGGAAVDGNVQVGGNFIGRDHIEKGNNRVGTVSVTNSVDLSSAVHDATNKLVLLALFALASIVLVVLFYPRSLPEPETPTSPTTEINTLSATPTLMPATPTIKAQSRLPYQINFQYLDEPTNHGWRATDGKELITYTYPLDEHYVRALTITTITSTAKYALDYSLNTDLRTASKVEVIAKLDKSSLFYVMTKLQSVHGVATKIVWFKFKTGTPSIKRVESKDEEWQIAMSAENIGGGWQKLSIDLPQVIAETVDQSKTVEQREWRLQALHSFRLRGNLSIASIKLYQ